MKPKDIRQRILDYKGTFATEEGDRVLGNLSAVCLEEDLTYVLGDANASAFNEGKRYVILHIRRLIDADPNNKALAKEILDSERTTNG